MTRSCPLCQKTSKMGGKRKLLRAHYNPTKWERKYPNLQWATLPSRPGARQAGKRIKICTKCIKKGNYLKIGV